MTILKTNLKYPFTKRKPNESLKNFFHKYLNYDKSSYPYWGQISEDLKVKSIKGIIEILANGFILFFSLAWILTAYRIKYGLFTSYIDIPILIISFGCASKLFQGTYRFVKNGWRD